MPTSAPAHPHGYTCKEYIIESTHHVITSLSNSANVEAMEYAKMEARGFQTPQVHNLENVEMV